MITNTSTSAAAPLSQLVNIGNHLHNHALIKYYLKVNFIEN